jgi:hypothetical protein
MFTVLKHYSNKVMAHLLIESGTATCLLENVFHCTVNFKGWKMCDGLNSGFAMYRNIDHQIEL